MAFNPAWIPAIIGGASSLFGGGRGGPDYVGMQLAKFNQLFDEHMRLYRATDWEAIDKKSLDQFKKTSLEQSDQAINNYSSRAAAAGYGAGFSDTEKTRTIGRLAKQGADQAANMEAQLAASRPMRQKGMLPDPSSAMGGLNAASFVDQWNSQQKSSEQLALMQLAQMIGQGWKKGGRQQPSALPPNIGSVLKNFPGLSLAR